MMSAEVVITTNGGPHGHVHAARNLSSLSDRPWRTQARRNRQLARPMDTQAIWFDTPTMFCNQPHSWPLPMKLLPKHRMLTLLVARSAGMGIPDVVVHEKIFGACGWGTVVASPYRTRVPAKSAWFPAESTEVRITVFMNEADTAGQS